MKIKSGEDLQKKVDQGKEIHDTKTRNMDLSHLKLKGSVFSRCSFKKCRFFKTDFSGASFDMCEMKDCDFNEANFFKAKISGTNLSRSSFHNANFEGGRFDFCDLEGTDLSEANLTAVSFVETDVRRAYLRKAKGLALDAKYPVFGKLIADKVMLGVLCLVGLILGLVIWGVSLYLK